MRLGVVITQSPFNQLSDQLLNHNLNHSPDVFYKKSRPYTKVTIPPGYTENQALCQQFGISPHSILCMEPTLWRQQIVDEVIFDLSKNKIQINFINGSRSLYSFNQAHEILNRIKSLNQAASTPFTSQELFLCDKITNTLILHLRFLHSIHQRGAEFVTDLDQLCTLSTQELAMLRKKIEPYPLTPTPTQVAIDDRRSRQKLQIPILINKKSTKSRRSSSLGIPHKKRNLNQSANKNAEIVTQSSLTQVTSTFQLSNEDLYQAIIHLTRYRATLLDFFQSVVLSILRTELPELYSLWVLQSQIDSLQDQFKQRATALSEILYRNQTLSLFERGLHSSKHQSDSLDELHLWCQVAYSSNSSSHIGPLNAEPIIEPEDVSSFSHHFNIDTPELMSSTDTSFNELSSSQTGGNRVGISYQLSNSETSIYHINSQACCSILHHDSSSQFKKSFPNHILPTLTGASNWPGLPSSFDTTETKLLVDSMTFVKHMNSAQKDLLLPGSNLPRVPTQSIFQVPLLLLEQDLLESIKSEDQKQLAVDLVIKLAEGRLEMEKLSENFRILKLLEEERYSREEFSGISRLSDIITTGRLSLGMERGEGDNISQNVIIKAALKRTNQINSYQGNFSQHQKLNNNYRHPSKASELKRQQAIKRKAWSASVRRLDRTWINNAEQELKQVVNSQNQIWPEPIFLKNDINIININHNNFRHINLKRKRLDPDQIHFESNLNSPSPSHLVQLDPSTIPKSNSNSSIINNNNVTTQSSTSIVELRNILLNL